jgi:hypothetical protein
MDGNRGVTRRQITTRRKLRPIHGSDPTRRKSRNLRVTCSIGDFGVRWLQATGLVAVVNTTTATASSNMKDYVLITLSVV